MTRTLLLPWPVYKEVRALALAWLGCMAATVAPTLVHAPRYVAGIQVVAYLIGTSVLGALSIGHEYMDRTLPLLLSVPARRERLLVIKLSVLAAMLVPLGVAAYTYVFHDSGLSPEARLEFSVLPVLGGLFLAPWLTMVCRSPVAGAALTLATPGVLAALAAGFDIWFGHGSGGFVVAIAVLRVGTLAMCAIGAVAIWRTFTRLEATGCLEDLRVPAWPSLGAAAAPAAARTPRHSIWLLVNKELRLQQLAPVMAGLYLFGWLAVTLLFAAEDRGLYLALSPLHAGLLGVLVGSIASAEERQLGTLEWQVLQPLVMWKQWAVKMAVVFGVPMLLGIGLPALLASVAPAPGAYLAGPPGAVVASAVLLLTAVSLYVSSLCTSGAWAMIMSVPAVFGGFGFLWVTSDWIAGAGFGDPCAALWWDVVYRAPRDISRNALVRDMHRFQVAVDAAILLLIAGLIATLAVFALANHRMADRSLRRVAKQILLIAAYVIVAVIMVGAVAPLFLPR